MFPKKPLRLSVLAYSGPGQTSKVERFAKIVMGKNSITFEIILFFDNFRGRKGVEIN